MSVRHSIEQVINSYFYFVVVSCGSALKGAKDRVIRNGSERSKVEMILSATLSFPIQTDGRDATFPRPKPGRAKRLRWVISCRDNRPPARPLYPRKRHLVREA
jgi:hypothetical protein